MIPYKDDNPTRRFPVVTVAIITANVIAFLFELTLGSRLDEYVMRLGVMPIRYFYDGIQLHNGEVYTFTLAQRILTPFSSMFLHAGWMHIIGNMLYLWVFGDNIEDRMGRLRFLVFYLLSGLAAAAAQVASNPESPVPMIGASGAVAGVLGAYLMLYPRVKVRVLIPIYFIYNVAELPAFVVLGFWFILQLAQGWFALGGAVSGGVAWWAHIGGFVFGMLLVHLFKKRRPSLMREERSLMDL